MNPTKEEKVVKETSSENSMISRKQWVVLVIFYILYLFLGGGVFFITERSFELENLKQLHMEQRKLTSALSQIENMALKTEIREAVRKLEQLTQLTILLPDTFKELVTKQLKTLREQSNMTTLDFNQTDINITETLLAERIYQLQLLHMTDVNETDNQTLYERLWQDTAVDDALVEEEAQWTLYNSFFFSFQTITTIGFGKLSPRTDHGKAFFLAYAIFGIAFNGIVFASLADLFSKKFVKKIDNKRYESKLLIVFDAILYFIPGVVIFFIAPAVVFMIVESWDFLSSFYYVIVTLTTIGFGDMVSGDVKLAPSLLWLYRIFIHAWILFGLGYLLMIITFIQQALRSKQIRILDRKIKRLLKQKSTKSPANVQNDLNKLRSVLKAINIYKEGIENLQDEKVNNNIDIKVEDVEIGKINRGFEADVPIQRSPFPERKLSKEMDPIEIFLTIASTVLKESEKRELLTRVSKNNGDRKDGRHDDLTKTLRKTLGLSCENIVSAVNNDVEGDVKSDTKDDETRVDDNGKKLSIKRKLSAWTLNVLPASMSKADLASEQEGSQDESNEDIDDDDDETQDNPDKINDLGDLINKVEEIVTQEITETNERIRRSVSYDCVTTRTKPYFFLE